MSKNSENSEHPPKPKNILDENGYVNGYNKFKIVIFMGSIAIVYIFLYLIKIGLFSLSDNIIFPNLDISFRFQNSIFGHFLSNIFQIINLILSLFFGIRLFNTFGPNFEKDKSESLTLPSKRQPSSKFRSYMIPFSSNQFGKQIIQGFMLLTMIYIPIDCLGYMVPGILDYSANQFEVFSPSDQNYFQFSFLLMLLITIGLNFFTALREEVIFREFILLNEQKKTKSQVGLVFSALIFSFGHFSYIFVLDSEYSWFFPIWWGLNALIIGFVSAWFFLKFQRLWPLIFAHLGNNVISSIALRFYSLHYSFWTYTLPYLYGVFLFAGLLFYIFYFNSVKQIYMEIFDKIRSYFNNLQSIKEGIIDFIVCLLLFLISMILIST